MHRAAAAPIGTQVAQRVAADLGGATEEQHVGAHTAATQQTGDDQAVAAVVALAGADQGAPAPAPHVRKSLEQSLRRSRAGTLHQDVAGDPEALDRQPVERPHLLGGNEEHVPAAAAARATRIRSFISRVACSMPTNSARATMLWPMLSSWTSGPGRDRIDVVQSQPVPGVDDQAQCVRIGRGGAETLQLLVACGGGSRIRIGAGVQLDDVGARPARGVDLPSRRDR